MFQGQILDAQDYSPLPGANIVYIDALGNTIYSKLGTASDSSGSFALDNIEPGDRIRASFVGYHSEEYQHTSGIAAVALNMTPSTEDLGTANVTTKRGFLYNILHSEIAIWVLVVLIAIAIFWAAKKWK